MGVSTDGQLCFGYLFEEGFEFPWDDEQFEDGYEDWWKHINGYENPHEDPFTDDGEWKEGFSRDCPKTEIYYDYKRKWESNNPFPVEIINYCSYDCPMYIIAIPETCKSNRRGYPVEVDPATLVVPEQLQRFKDWFEEHNIETEGEPKWWLSSFWG